MSAETVKFTAEVKELFQLMIHSLYSNKEIFLRELISNASDASDKLRFLALHDPSLYEPALKVMIDFDKTARTITLKDNGIGMTREEVVTNLGTIAKSGTKEFLSKLSGAEAENAKLIGQFGVGFYSAFIVADKVTVLTRKAGMTPEHGVRWESKGDGEYTLENIERAERGTEIILHLKEDAEEFLENWRLRNVITKYSDHIDLPIYMKKYVPEKSEDEKEKSDAQEEAAPEWEVVNKATALWTQPKSELKEEDYKEFYKHISHDFQDPISWAHHRVEGKQEYISLLYLPSRAPFDLWNRDAQRGLKLYVQRVFIMDNAENFLPMYLRFIKGVLDSKDLPLNISREILQSNPAVEKLKSALTKRALGMIEKLSENSEEYQKFWKEFGKVLKEGPAEDFANREQIAALLRFATTLDDQEAQTQTLDGYIARMPEGQDKIYYVTAESFIAAKNSPHLEIFRKKGIEVLLLSDRVDEWLMAHLTEYKDKKFQSITRGDLDLGKMEDTEEKEQQEKLKDEFDGVIKHIQTVLKNQVKEVRITHRLTASPACIVADETDMNANMKRLLASMGQEMPEDKPIFEINPEHPIIHRLKDQTDDARFEEWAHILFDQAVLAEGGHLKNPAEFVRRLNQLLLALA